MTLDPSYRALNQPWRWTRYEAMENAKRYRDQPVTHVPSNIEMFEFTRESRRQERDYEARLRATEAMESDKGTTQ